jgi:transcriptional regulator with XRE-family HTH domain
MPLSLREKFARAVRASRKQSGLSQAEAAERAGIASEAYGRLERGAVLPRAETLVSLSQTFGVTCDQLLGLSNGKDHGLVGAADSALAKDPELRRLITQLDGLSPRTLHLIGNVLRAIRSDVEGASGAK